MCARRLRDLSYDQIRNLCKGRGNNKKDAKAALRTRLEAMGAVERQSIMQKSNEMDTSSSVLGKRARSMEEQSALEQNQQKVEGKRSRGDVPATAMEVDLAVAQAHAQWWPWEHQPKLEVNPSAAAEGVDGAISARVADKCNRVLGQELSREEEEMHADLANEGKRRELAAWDKFDVFSPLSGGKVRKQIVQTRWVITWEMAEAKE